MCGCGRARERGARGRTGREAVRVPAPKTPRDANTNTKNRPSHTHPLSRGYSVLLFGVGSKRALLDKFAASASPGGVLSVDAGAPGATARGATLAAARGASARPAGALRPRRWRRWLPAHPTAASPCVCTGSTALRVPPTRLLSQLLPPPPPTRLIATADHASVPLLWDTSVAAAFNWRWVDATTYAPHPPRDLRRLPGLSAGDRDDATADTALAVLDALVPNARAVFGLLAEAQLAGGVVPSVDGCAPAAPTDGATGGVSHDALLRAARERFLAASDATLAAYLAEFRDHGLLAARRGGAGGGDTLSIPLPRDALAAVVDALAAGPGGGEEEEDGGGA